MQHHSMMRRDQWRKYKEITDAEKTTYFSVDTPFGETIPSFFYRCVQANVKSDVHIIEKSH